MSTTYRLSPSATEQDTNRILVRSLSFNTAIMLIPFFVMLLTGQLSNPTVLITLLIVYSLAVPLLIWFTVRRVRRMMKNAVETYELTIDDLQITRTQRECPTVVIPRAEVKRISERAGQGFRIETASSRQNIWVPKELEGYEQAKALLLSSPAQQLKTTRHPLVITYTVALLGLAAFLVLLYSQQRSLVIASGAAILCFYIYYIFEVVRTWQNLSRTAKRSLWAMVLVLFIVISRVASVWR